jgi:hypothetical protein
MSLATLDLPKLATKALEASLLPYVTQLWFGKPLLTLGTMFILAWNHGIRYPFNIGNPAEGLTGSDASDAVAVIGVYCLFVVSFTLLAIFVHWTMGLPDLLNPWELLPTDVKSLQPYHGLGKKRGGNVEDIVDSDLDTGIARDNITNIPRPTKQFFIYVLLFLFTVAAPYIIYSCIMDAHPLAAFCCIVIIPAIGNILAWLYSTFYTALSIHGPTPVNCKEYNKFNGLSKGDDRYLPQDENTFPPKIQKLTTNRINWHHIVMGIPHVLGNCALGAVRAFISEDVDVNWKVALSIGLIILLLTIITAIVFKFKTKSKKSKKDKKLKEEEEEEGEGDGEVVLDNQGTSVVNNDANAVNPAIVQSHYEVLSGQFEIANNFFRGNRTNSF